MMIIWDEENKQILTKQCLRCPEPYFSPRVSGQPHVGCCSYSPVFTLFEIGKMVKDGQRSFFLDHIYGNRNNTIRDYEITVHANIHPQYDAFVKGKDLSEMEKQDLKASLSICQFFVPDRGCGLDPRYKNKICRSFICSAVEEQMGHHQKQDLTHWVKTIREEAERFHSFHRKVLKDKGWNFHHHMDAILDYLEALADPIK